MVDPTKLPHCIAGTYFRLKGIKGGRKEVRQIRKEEGWKQGQKQGRRKDESFRKFSMTVAQEGQARVVGLAWGGLGRLGASGSRPGAAHLAPAMRHERRTLASSARPPPPWHGRAPLGRSCAAALLDDRRTKVSGCGASLHEENLLI
jgi:hypothetical protein